MVVPLPRHNCIHIFVFIHTPRHIRQYYRTVTHHVDPIISISYIKNSPQYVILVFYTLTYLFINFIKFCVIQAHYFNLFIQAWEEGLS